MGLICLKENADALYDYIRILVNHLITPLIFPPDDLRRILVSVKHDMRTIPKSELLDDQNKKKYLGIFLHYAY